MPAMLFAGMPYRGHGPPLSYNPYIIDFTGYYALCRSGFSREFFAAQQSFAAKAAPTTAGSPQFAARQRGVWTTGDLLQLQARPCGRVVAWISASAIREKTSGLTLA